jgi:hypothetical protein
VFVSSLSLFRTRVYREGEEEEGDEQGNERENSRRRETAEDRLEVQIVCDTMCALFPRPSPGQIRHLPHCGPHTFLLGFTTRLGLGPALDSSSAWPSVVELLTFPPS